MSASYSIDVDVARSIVRITMSGFFGPDDIGGFLARRKSVHARLTCEPNMHCTITDTREMKIQSQDIVAMFQDMLADPAYRSRKLAFVTAPTLARPQLLRAIGSRGARVFDNHADAEAWVLAATVGDAAAA
ncbi:hypothetical protein M9980_00815 [Sphingomonas donggukensis]|uniref:STAS/SEC14 domain-containing protein n=1 Tax=Sphingomonas donggukensis TaxID=2949093 RepID=A0ABY4TVR4_9SPHN|nr:hypothetical protein [Sphingomonas donggukensis]URW75811.1 hypothetical protein M9980_00815 [Sphingomonas donggukensis]